MEWDASGTGQVWPEWPSFLVGQVLSALSFDSRKDAKTRRREEKWDGFAQGRGDKREAWAINHFCTPGFCLIFNRHAGLVPASTGPQAQDKKLKDWAQLLSG